MQLLEFLIILHYLLRWKPSPVAKLVKNEFFSEKSRNMASEKLNFTESIFFFCVRLARLAELRNCRRDREREREREWVSVRSVDRKCKFYGGRRITSKMWEMVCIAYADCKSLIDKIAKVLFYYYTLEWIFLFHLIFFLVWIAIFHHYICISLN